MLTDVSGYSSNRFSIQTKKKKKMQKDAIKDLKRQRWEKLNAWLRNFITDNTYVMGLM